MKMKKAKNNYAIVLILFALSLVCSSNTLRTSAPHAALSMNISSVKSTPSGSEFDLTITATIPTEPYSSLDFNLLSSDRNALAIASKSEDELDISFVSDLGTVWHPGRDETDGAGIDYLIGLYSTSGTNEIADGFTVCTIRMTYTGDTPQTLTIPTYQLVFMNGTGQVDNMRFSEEKHLTVDPEILAQIAADESNSEEKGFLFWIYVGISVLIFLGVLFAIIAWRRKTASRYSM